jgi:hypothetical protein
MTAMAQGLKALGKVISKGKLGKTVKTKKKTGPQIKFEDTVKKTAKLVKKRNAADSTTSGMSRAKSLSAKAMKMQEAKAIAKGDKTKGKYNKKVYDNKLAGVSDPKKRQLALSMGKGGPAKVKAVYAAQAAIRAAAKAKGMKVKAFRKRYPNNKHVKALYKLKPNIRLDDIGDKGFRVYGGH